MLFFFLMIRRPPRSTRTDTLFPYTTLFRSIENSSTSRDREAGYSQQLLQLGKEKPVREVGNYTFEGATEAARALFKRRSRPDAIFCANDHMALAAIEVARSEFGLEVGRHVSIIGLRRKSVG